MTRTDGIASIPAATDYFSRIAELLSGVEYTDGQGRPDDVNIGIQRLVQRVLQIRDAGGRIMLIGNGGSAAIAGHTAMDLCNQIKARACTFNEPMLLTSLSNDHGYGCVFERGVSLWGEAGDALIAVSSSGKSESISRAVQAARERDVCVATFSGFRPDNPLRQMGDWNFYVASERYGEVETAHHVLGHCLTDLAAAAGRS